MATAIPTSDWEHWLAENSQLIQQDILRLASAAEFLLQDAEPPEVPGVYMFLVDSEIMYVGEAKGSGGLYDRVIRKHISGDEKHTLHRVFLSAFPDKNARRNFLKQHITVKWVEIDDPDRVSSVERLMIQMLKPPWNRA